MATDTAKIEEWRPIADWIGLYEVSSHGRVRSLDRVVKGKYGPTRYKGRVLKLSYRHGYACVVLAETGRGRKTYRFVHHLVLETFVGSRPPRYDACHGPNGEWDNSVENLRWDTRKSNILDQRLWGKLINWHPKPPTQVACSVCASPMLVTYRRYKPNHVCSPACKSEFGKRSVRLRKTGTFLAIALV